MPRTVKCGLIQCSNAAPTDLPFDDIKRLISKSTWGLSNKQPRKAANALHAGSFHDTLLLCGTADALVRSCRENPRW